MEWDFVKRENLSFSWLEVSAAFAGKDVVACVQGGCAPHIGCAVLAVPRPSLKGDGSARATSSVLNLPGHKDEALCRALAEILCRRLETAVVCTGGFHEDGILPEQIAETIKALESMGNEAAEFLAASARKKAASGSPGKDRHRKADGN